MVIQTTKRKICIEKSKKYTYYKNVYRKFVKSIYLPLINYNIMNKKILLQWALSIFGPPIVFYIGFVLALGNLDITSWGSNVQILYVFVSGIGMVILIDSFTDYDEL